MFRKLKKASLLLVTFSAITSGCGTVSGEEMTRYCPGNMEAEIRTDFEVSGTESLTLSAVLAGLDEREVFYERVTRDIASRHCESPIEVSNASAYRAYFGKSADGTYAKNYLIVANEAGAVEFIEARHSYRAP